MSPSTGNTVNLAVIGAGLVSDYHHVPGIRLDPRARLAVVCDTDEALLEKRRADWEVEKVSTDPEEIFSDAEIDAVIIATPPAGQGRFAGMPNGRWFACLTGHSVQR